MDADLNASPFLATPPFAGSPSAALLRVAKAFALGLRAVTAGPRGSRSARGEHELHGMSDRDLADLGIGRGEIPGLLDGAARNGTGRRG